MSPEPEGDNSSCVIRQDYISWTLILKGATTQGSMPFGADLINLWFMASIARTNRIWLWWAPLFLVQRGKVKKVCDWIQLRSLSWGDCHWWWDVIKWKWNLSEGGFLFEIKLLLTCSIIRRNNWACKMLTSVRIEPLCRLKLELHLSSNWYHGSTESHLRL